MSVILKNFFNCYVISHLVSDDHSRVKLENSENDYINASLVMVEEAQRAYILSQVTVWHRQCKSRCLHSYALSQRSSFASTGAFEEYLWSFLADDLGTAHQSCYNAQQSH